MNRLNLLIQADSVDAQQAGVFMYTKNIVENLKFKDFKLLKFKSNSEKEIALQQKKMIGGGSWRFFWQMPNLINELSPKIFWQPAHLLPPRIDKKIQKIITIHDLSSITMPQFHTRMNVLGHKLLLKKSILDASGIITISETIKQEIVERYNPAAKITVIYNGANLSPVVQKPVQFNFNKYFVFVGTVEPRKNLETLIKAYLKIKHKVPEKLVIIGNPGWKSDAIFALIKANTKDIFYLGHITEAEKNYYIQQATALVYPSLYEGFGLPPLEAMILKTPVITSKAGSLKELYADYALQFEALEVDQLVQHLLSVSSNLGLRDNLRRRGFEYAKCFSWQKTADSTAEFFKEFL